jgi:radical SAM superfamily enzyme YgiQ (UPF0313 family)
MRVLLIHTNQFNFGQLPKNIEKNRGLNPPISLAYIAAAVLQANFQVRLLDMDAEKVSIPDLIPIVRNYNPDVIGFSVMLNNLSVNLLIARFLKRFYPKIITVFGGVFVNLFPESILSHKEVDIGVTGEGEICFPLLLEALEKGENLNHIPGIIFKQENKTIKTKNVEPIQNLDSIAPPARHLLQIHKYTSLIAKRSPITILFTSRGCPFHCSFCSKPSFWHNIRYNSPKYVADEFEQCAKLGIKEIMVYDDVFTANKNRVELICKEIIARKLDLVWDIRTRADLIDLDRLKWLKSAGCNRICYGVESGDPHILKIYNKQLSYPQVKRAFELTRKMGLETLAYFMIGGPDESVRSIQRTYTAMLDLDPDYIHLTHVIPYPKTKLFDLALIREIADISTWENIHNYSWDAFPMFTDGELNRKQIDHYVQKGYRLFYFRPKYILKRLKMIRSFDQLWRYIKAALSI